MSLSPPTEGRKQRPSLAPRWALTQAGHGEHAGSRGRGDAVGEYGLQYVVGEGHGDDGQAGRVHDEDGAPEQQEAGTSKGSSGTGIPLPSRPRCVEWGCTLGPGIQRRVPVPEAGFGPGRQGQTCRGLDSIVDSFDRDSVQHSSTVMCYPWAGVEKGWGTNRLSNGCPASGHWLFPALGGLSWGLHSQFRLQLSAEPCGCRWLTEL